MSDTKWKASEPLIRQFQAIGRALLLSDMEDSHSGNIARRWVDDAGHERIVITSTGSQKGDLEANNICFLSTRDTDYGHYKASSETDIHARILNIEGVDASVHAHTKELTIVTFDDEEKPNQPAPFIPLDPLGYYHMGGLVPVDWVAVRGIKSMLYAPKGSMPRDLPGPLMEVPLEEQAEDSRELQIHKALYANSNFQTVAHCYVPEAEVLANFIYPGEEQPDERIVAIDAEGSFLYLVVPVVPAKVDTATLVELLHDYKVVIVRGGGVWGVGMQSLSEVLHHPSSVREICLYRIGAFERGLNLRTLEPEKAKRW